MGKAFVEVRFSKDGHTATRSSLALNMSSTICLVANLVCQGRNAMEDTGASPLEAICSLDEFSAIMREIIDYTGISDPKSIEGVWVCSLPVHPSARMRRSRTYRLRGADGRSLVVRLGKSSKTLFRWRTRDPFHVPAP